jgi:Na+-driven multidrug efflux pump
MMGILLVEILVGIMKAIHAIIFMFLVGFGVTFAIHWSQPIVEKMPDPWGTCFSYAIWLSVIVGSAIGWQWLEDRGRG